MEQADNDRGDQDPSQHVHGAESAAESNPAEDPRIYAASLTDYNNGLLHGAWIGANQDREELEHAVQVILDGSPTGGAEEFAIFDFEGFGPWRLHEYESLDTVTLVARGIVEHGQAFAHWIGVVESTDPEVVGGFEDAYLGHWDSSEDYARSYVEDVVDLDNAVDLPGFVSDYLFIDYKAMARDFEISGDIITSEGDGGVYVFAGNQ